MSDERPEGLPQLVNRLVLTSMAYGRRQDVPEGDRVTHDEIDALEAEVLAQAQREQSTALARLREDKAALALRCTYVQDAADNAEAEVTRLREERDRLRTLAAKWEGSAKFNRDDGHSYESFAWQQCADDLKAALSSPSASEKSPNSKS